MSDQIAHYADSVLALHRTKDEDGGRRTLLLCPRRVRCKGVALEWRWLWWSCPHCGQDWSDYDRRLRRRPPIALRTFKVAFVAGAVERIEDRLRMQRYAEMVQVVASRSLMLATDVENDNYIARRFYFVRSEPEREHRVERAVFLAGWRRAGRSA